MIRPQRLCDHPDFQDAFAAESSALHRHDLGRLRQSVVHATTVPSFPWASIAVAVGTTATVAGALLLRPEVEVLPAPVLVVQPRPPPAPPLVDVPPILPLPNPPLTPPPTRIAPIRHEAPPIPSATARESGLAAELASYRSAEAVFDSGDVEAAAALLNAHLAAFPEGELRIEAELLRLECSIRTEHWVAVVAQADVLLPELAPGDRQREVLAARERALDRLLR